MSDVPSGGPERRASWGDGSTAEDFADLVKDSIDEQNGGVVVVPFEDHTLPDHITLGGTVTLGEHTLSYAEFFAGALEHFHGIKDVRFRAVQVSAPFVMGLEVTVSQVTPS